jgi:hypothetical protein
VTGGVAAEPGRTSVHLLVDGRRVQADTIDGDRLVFRLHAPFSDIRLRSGRGRPADLIGQADDTRMLGVCLRRMRWQQGGAEIDVPLASPGFIDGFYHLETPSGSGRPFRWTNGDAALPADGCGSWTGELRLELVVGTWAGSAVSAPADGHQIMLRGFDSLGENCELAIMQRHYGVELPLSLLRWSGTTYAKLLHGLEQRFDGLGDAERTNVSWVTTDYRLETPYLNMHTTDIQPRDEAGVAEILHAGCATLRLLRRKMLGDIAAAKRIYVFKTADPDVREPEMHRLFGALRAIGPVSLLCVTLAPDRPPGEVRRLADGLYAGTVDRFVSPDGPFDLWLDLCAQAQKLFLDDVRQRGRG